MTEKMNSQERVRAAVKRQPLDRAPVFLWINAHTGCKLMARYKPSRYFRLNLLSRFLWDRFEKSRGESELWRFAPLVYDVHTFNWANAYSIDLGADIMLASFGTPWRYAKIRRKNGKFLMRDIYGVTRALGHGIYPDMVGPAIKDIKEAAAYQFPDPHDPRLYNIFRKYRKLCPHTSIAAEVWGPQDFTATSLFGMERFMFYLVDYPEEMKKFMRRWTDFHIEVLKKSVEAGADVVFIEDDYGYDNRPLISMKMWEEFTLPELKRLIDAAHEAGALAALHSCGFQMPFLPYYAEAGLDMLHAFQPKAGNDFAKAYSEYGDKLTFITGIDIQRGESMSPDELKDEIVANYKLAGLKGGHVLGTTHEIQYTMPDENVKTIFNTVDEIKAGRYD